MFEKKISKDQVNDLELDAYKGKVIVVVTQEQLVAALDEISQTEITGFDTETKPSFRKGENHQVALIQIATSEKVFLIRINVLGLADEVISFFENPDIKKIGLGLRDDIKALQKIKYFEPHGFIELTEITKEIGIISEGLRNLTALILGFRVSKNAQTSNWENETLSEKQVRYAATDAWVCMEMYKKLDFLGYV